MALTRSIAARMAVGAVLAGVAVGSVGAPAQAATGDVLIQILGGPVLLLHNPPPGCRTLATVGPGATVHNRTDTAISLYAERGCVGIPRVLNPGQSVTFTPGSIYVPS